MFSSCMTTKLKGGGVSGWRRAEKLKTENVDFWCGILPIHKAKTERFRDF